MLEIKKAPDGEGTPGAFGIRISTERTCLLYQKILKMSNQVIKKINKANSSGGMVRFPALHQI